MGFVQSSVKRSEVTHTIGSAGNVQIVFLYYALPEKIIKLIEGPNIILSILPFLIVAAERTLIIDCIVPGAGSCTKSAFSWWL